MLESSKNGGKLGKIPQMKSGNQKSAKRAWNYNRTFHEAGTAMTPNANTGFIPLAGLYVPSAIVQLADARFLFVGDEKDYPFSLVSIKRDGSVESTHLTPGLFESTDGFWKLDDLEGLSIDPSGWIYAITSQSLDGDGDSKKSREKLDRRSWRHTRNWPLPLGCATLSPVVVSTLRRWRLALTAAVSGWDFAARCSSDGRF